MRFNILPKSARLFVASLAVAVAGGAGLTAFAADGGHAHYGMHRGGMFMGAPMMGRGLDRMLDSVSATDAQRAQIKQIAQAAAADLKAQRDAGRALHEQAAALFTQPTVDANAAESLRQQMLAQHDQVSRRMMQAMLDISRVLTPEQRQQLAQKMQQRRQMMEDQMRERQQQSPKQ
ncbi:MAG TPA: Spy/CpxP family protein refolding chaperone [Burkholderiaceae bacterium]|nr:Spy/CpxP family protein refolding chaperone [Burkholderiaceae bacterium]